MPTSLRVLYVVHTKSAKTKGLFYSKNSSCPLIAIGIMPRYNCWTSHGELGVAMEEDEQENNNGIGLNTVDLQIQQAMGTKLLKKATVQMILARCAM